MNHQRGTCRHCGRDIYRNLDSNERVLREAFVHRDTGGMFCDLTEETVAEVAS